MIEVDKLLRTGVRVINVGLHEFAHNLADCEAKVIEVDWSPPAVTDPKILELLTKLGG